MTVAILADRAAAIAGAEAVRAGAGEGDAFDGIVPGVIVEPRSAQAAAEVLSWATRERLSVVIAGGRTKAEWGRPPRAIDVLLSTAAMSRVVDHAFGDLTVTAEAGATISAVNAVLAARSQFLPFDVAQPHRATLGGVVATNDSGPLRHRYGTPRDLVIGATIATADGVLARSGGQVAKNVAGYDLARLLAGSHGSLAALLTLTFKVLPLPAATGTVVLTGTPDQFLAAWAGIVREQIEPMAADVRSTRGELPLLLVRFGSDATTVERSLTAVQAVARAVGGGLTSRTSEDDAGLWNHGTGPWPARHVVRMSWATTDLPNVFHALAALPQDMRWTLAGRAAVGSGHVGFDADPAIAETAVRALREAPALAHVTIVRSTPDVRRAIDPWGPLPGAAAVWPSLKHAWDPTNTLGAARGPL